MYNSNDCLPSTKAINFIKNKFKKVDLALLPYTGVSGYPNCYLNLTHEEKLKEAKGFQLKVWNPKKTAQAIKPDLIMPFADQFVIGGKNSI